MHSQRHKPTAATVCSLRVFCSLILMQTLPHPLFLCTAGYYVVWVCLSQHQSAVEEVFPRGVQMQTLEQCSSCKADPLAKFLWACKWERLAATGSVLRLNQKSGHIVVVMQQEIGIPTFDKDLLPIFGIFCLLVWLNALCSGVETDIINYSILFRDCLV